MENLSKTIRNHKNTTQTISGTIAAIGLEKVGQKTAGVLVTPAVWVLNYSADGSKPSGVDAGIYASGFLSAGASVAVSLMKSVLDDDLQRKFEMATKSEPPKYAPFIKTCYHFASNPQLINAQRIASKGGTAWMHSNGLWLYITDSRGNMVADYKPKSAVKVYQPVYPFQRNNNGSLIWGQTK